MFIIRLCVKFQLHNPNHNLLLASTHKILFMR